MMSVVGMMQALIAVCRDRISNPGIPVRAGTGCGRCRMGSQGIRRIFHDGYKITSQEASCYSLLA